MKITNDHVTKLLGLLSHGLCSGSGIGRYDGDYCVQNAVCIATGLSEPGSRLSDKPSECVARRLIYMGIKFNDCGYWIDKIMRADGLRAFAVAELGSKQINIKRFNKVFARLCRKNKVRYKIMRSVDVPDLINCAVESLIICRSPGVKFLPLVDPKYKELIRKLQPKRKTERNNNAKRTRKQGSKQTKAKEEVQETNPFPTATAEPAVS